MHNSGGNASILLHWALIPQAFGRRQRFTHEPSIQLLVCSHSEFDLHSMRLHSTFGFPCKPWGQRQIERWFATLHSAVLAHLDIESLCMLGFLYIDCLRSSQQHKTSLCKCNLRYNLHCCCREVNKSPWCRPRLINKGSDNKQGFWHLPLLHVAVLGQSLSERHWSDERQRPNASGTVPGGHWHWYAPIVLIHIAVGSQGLLRHSSISTHSLLEKI